MSEEEEDGCEGLVELRAAVEQLHTDVAELRNIALFRVVIEGLKK